MSFLIRRSSSVSSVISWLNSQLSEQTSSFSLFINSSNILSPIQTRQQTLSVLNHTRNDVEARLKDSIHIGKDDLLILLYICSTNDEIDCSFALSAALSFLQEHSIAMDKQIVYSFLALQSQNFSHLLIVNALLKDLQSNNVNIICAALRFIIETSSALLWDNLNGVLKALCQNNNTIIRRFTYAAIDSLNSATIIEFDLCAWIHERLTVDNDSHCIETLLQIAQRNNCLNTIDMKFIMHCTQICQSTQFMNILLQALSVNFAQPKDTNRVKNLTDVQSFLVDLIDQSILSHNFIILKAAVPLLQHFTNIPQDFFIRLSNYIASLLNPAHSQVFTLNVNSMYVALSLLKNGLITAYPQSVLKCQIALVSLLQSEDSSLAQLALDIFLQIINEQNRKAILKQIFNSYEYAMMNPSGPANSERKCKLYEQILKLDFSQEAFYWMQNKLNILPYQNIEELSKWIGNNDFNLELNDISDFSCALTLIQLKRRKDLKISVDDIFIAALKEYVHKCSPLLAYYSLKILLISGINCNELEYNPMVQFISNYHSIIFTNELVKQFRTAENNHRSLKLFEGIRNVTNFSNQKHPDKPEKLVIPFYEANIVTELQKDSTEIQALFSGID